MLPDRGDCNTAVWTGQGQKQPHRDILLSFRRTVCEQHELESAPPSANRAFSVLSILQTPQRVHMRNKEQGGHNIDTRFGHLAVGPRWDTTHNDQETWWGRGILQY